jgi:hypothetical protein
MSVRSLVFIVAAFVLGLGLFLGFRSHSAYNVPCGSAFSPDSSHAVDADRQAQLNDALGGPVVTIASTQNACIDAIGSQPTVAWALTGVGGLAAAGAAITHATSRPRRSVPAVSPADFN